jgi:hypothetical protein
MNYSPSVIAFFIGLITSFIIISGSQKDTLIGTVAAQGNEMEAVWYPESK